MRQITYCDAINEALTQEMTLNDKVFVYGIDVADHKNIFGSTKGLVEKFGKNRCFSTPLAEDAMTGFGVGAAINGYVPVHVHMRVDFMTLAYNQITNILSTYRFGTHNKVNMPMVIRAIVGRGWGQGYQHSKTLYSSFAHIPGIKVYAPATPYDAKGMLISALRGKEPVIFFEHRWLYWQLGDVPKKAYTINNVSPKIIRQGSDITLVSSSWMTVEAVQAADILKKLANISVEVIDVPSLSPLNIFPIINSIKKTKHCIVLDNDWSFCGMSAEITAQLHEACFNMLKKPIGRIGFVFTPCPTARHMENEFYPNAEDIIRKVEKTLGISSLDLSKEEFYSYEKKFKGPF